MARAAKPTRAATGRPRGRPPGSVSSKAPARTAPKATPTSRAAAKAPAPKISKGELRAEVEKLERSNATLRTKIREAGRAAKAAAARIEELEQQVARLEKAASRERAKAERGTARARSARRERPERDPGDAVPPGVAVAEPAPLDEQAEAALERLEKLGEP